METPRTHQAVVSSNIAVELVSRNEQPIPKTGMCIAIDRGSIITEIRQRRKELHDLSRQLSETRLRFIIEDLTQNYERFEAAIENGQLMPRQLRIADLSNRITRIDVEIRRLQKLLR